MNARWEARLNNRKEIGLGIQNLGLLEEYMNALSKFERWQKDVMKTTIGFDDVLQVWPILRPRNTIVPDDMNLDARERCAGQVMDCMRYLRGQHREDPALWKAWRKQAALMFHDDKTHVWIGHVRLAEQPFVQSAVKEVIKALNATKRT